MAPEQMLSASCNDGFKIHVVLQTDYYPSTSTLSIFDAHSTCYMTYCILNVYQQYIVCVA